MIPSADVLARFAAVDVTVLVFPGDDPAVLESWRAALPRARLVACLDASSAPRPVPEGVAIEQGARDDPHVLARLGESWTPAIVDDAATASPLARQMALDALYPRVVPGGLYIMAASQDARLQTRLHALRLALTNAGRDLTALPDMATAELARATESVVRHGAAIVLRRRRAPFERVRVVAAAEVAEMVVTLDNGGPYARVPATIEGAPPGLAESFARRLAAPVVVPPAAVVAVLRDVTVQGRGILVTDDGAVVAESLINTGASDRFGPFRRVHGPHGDTLEQATDGPAATPMPTEHWHVLLKQTWDNNFSHWLFETLPRVDLVAERFDMSEFRSVVADDAPAMRDVHRETLGMLGVRPEQIVWTDDAPMAFDRLIYPLPMTEQPWVKAPRVLRVLERLADIPPASAQGPARVFVRRGDGWSRQLLNEADVVTLLEARGYVIFTAGERPLSEEIAVFRDARVIVGIMGAALCRVGFCRAGVTLFALATEFMQDDFYWDIVCHKQGRYFSLHGPAANPDRGMQSDFTIDLAAFRRLLDAADPPV